MTRLETQWALRYAKGDRSCMTRALLAPTCTSELMTPARPHSSPACIGTHATCCVMPHLMDSVYKCKYLQRQASKWGEAIQPTGPVPGQRALTCGLGGQADLPGSPAPRCYPPYGCCSTCTEQGTDSAVPCYTDIFTFTRTCLHSSCWVFLMFTAIQGGGRVGGRGQNPGKGAQK